MDICHIKNLDKLHLLPSRFKEIATNHILLLKLHLPPPSLKKLHHALNLYSTYSVKAIFEQDIQPNQNKVLNFKNVHSTGSTSKLET